MKKKNKIIILIVLITILVILNGVTFSLFKNAPNEINLVYLEENESFVLVEKNMISKSIVSFLYKDEKDNYFSKIYNYDVDKEVEFDSLIKKEKEEDFQKIVNKLLDLKYPKFISDVLKKDTTRKSFLLRDNELVIYFNDYEFNPEVEEILYLTVNYNEIKDYLNFTVILDKNYENESGYNYTNSKKSVAITFDDSPNKNKTEKILASLKDNHFHATFFVVGEKAIYNKDLLISIKNSGNEIGTHTYSHKNMGKMEDEEVVGDFQKMNDLYKSLFQEDLKLLRPPYGIIKDHQKRLFNLAIINWSLDTNDWRYRNKDYLVNYVLNHIKDGDIILFHDSYDSTVAAINELLPILYSKGYQVMSVSELFKLKEKELKMNEIYHNAS